MKLDDIGILIVEDELVASEYLKEILLGFGPAYIKIVKNAKDAVAFVRKEEPALIFMDINIQGAVDGIECAKMISSFAKSFIIFTTAYKDNRTINEACDTNLSGYLIKPFREEDVFAVLTIVCKEIKREKCIEPLNDEILIDCYTYSIKSRTIHDGTTTVRLSPKEELILSTLMSHINCDVSYEFIMDQAWDGGEVSPSTIRDTLSRLRKKLPKLPIKNIPGYGYILKR